jgi:hypothetical protein
MSEPSLDERPASAAAREHPPFRMRDRRRRLLPDLTPPTLEELRWAARQRRLRRDPVIPEPRRDLHAASDGGEDAAVTATVEEPDVIELPEHPAVLPEPEPPAEVAIESVPAAQAVAQAPPDDIADDAPPPLVSHLLVVREPAPVESGRIAVLDEEPGDVATITRLIPLPDEAVADPVLDLQAHEDESYLEDLDDYVEPELPTVDGRPAPLYWRLLRLRYTRPNGWLRALFFEGAVAIAVVLVLAEVASVWTIVVLPFVVAVVVKANDVLAGSLRRSFRQPRGR